MKLSVSLLLLLAAYSPFQKSIEECAAASSSELTEVTPEDVGALRGANNNHNNHNNNNGDSMIIEEVKEETKKKNDVSGVDHIIATADAMMTMVQKEGGGDDHQFHRELEEGRRHRWSNHCSTGRTHEEKCGGSRPDCCEQKVKDENDNISFLTCRKKNEDSDNNRCHEIHSDAINWRLLCNESSSGSKRTRDQECNSELDCCQEWADFGAYHKHLTCKDGRCQEVYALVQWDQVCNSGQGAYDSCGGTDGNCCPDKFDYGNLVVGLFCEPSSGKCYEYDASRR